MAELTTVPMFVFYQGDPWAEETPSEYPIEVKYYNGTISLEQDGNTININTDFFEKLFKEIRKHKPAAEAELNK
jgi:hypothetical protein